MCGQGRAIQNCMRGKRDRQGREGGKDEKDASCYLHQRERDQYLQGMPLGSNKTSGPEQIYLE